MVSLRRLSKERRFGSAAASGGGAEVVGECRSKRERYLVADRIVLQIGLVRHVPDANVVVEPVLEIVKQLVGDYWTGSRHVTVA